MNILMIGDIVGEPGRNAVRQIVPALRARESINIVIANGENAAGGSGLTPKIFNELINNGIDIVTSGDHIFKKKEILDIIDFQDRLVRPANYPEGVSGHGSTIFSFENGKKIGVINLAGRVFMQPLDCPFRKGLELLKQIKKETPVVVIDMHAEATSEKIAMGWYLNGQASVVFGTHTHVQTADERILPEHDYTAYITDVGMTGPIDSVIGRKVDQILTRFLNNTPTRFEVAEGNVQLQGIIVEVDEKSGRAISIKRIQEKLS